MPSSLASPEPQKDIKRAPYDLLALTKRMDRQMIGTLKEDHVEFGIPAAPSRRY
jgi:hypothetical protein